jgi:pimeloyl-ACP methyl ester carboxylesterase
MNGFFERRSTRRRRPGPVGTVLARAGAILFAGSLALLGALPAAAQLSAPLPLDPNAIPGQPGTLISSEPTDGAPDGAVAYRFLYRSTDSAGQPIAVSGLAVIPVGPGADRPIVAWDHPTSGIVERCAPSLARKRYQFIPGLAAMIARGYVVVATDYPGLGSPGPHPYLVGASEARATLDAVRAVRLLPDARAGNRFVVWGHSQGGQAALFTGLDAASYAPDLKLLGVAAAAPATDLAALLTADLDTPAGQNLTAMTLWSWSRVFGAPADKVMDPAAAATVDRLAQECIESIYDLELRKLTTRPLRRHFLTDPNFAQHAPWAALMAANTPGVLPANIPVFVAQGTQDQIVRPEITRAYIAKLCKAGVAVEADWVEGVGHGFVALKSAAATIAWIADRFAGAPAPSDCDTAT